MWRTFIGLDGNEWDSHLRCLIGFDRSAPPIQGRKPVPIKSYFVLIKLYKLPRVAHGLEVAQELVARDNHRATAIVGVERKALGLL